MGLALALATVVACSTWFTARPGATPPVGAASSSGPTVDIGAISVSEGSAGPPRSVRFPVTLSEPARATVRATWTVVTGTADAADLNLASGTVTFKVGSNGQTAVTRVIPVSVRPDTEPESDETFSVVLSAVDGAALGNARGTGTILDDDPATGARVAVGDATIYEGDAGNRSVLIPVSLSAPLATDASVGYSLAEATAVAKIDYRPSAATVRFPAGATLRTIAVVVASGDTDPDPAETVAVRLRAPVGVTIGRGDGLLTIVRTRLARTVFVDDFDGTSLAGTWYRNRWFANTCSDGAVEGEEQYYTARSVAVGGGVLALTAERNDFTCAEAGGTLPFTSGWVQTGGRRAPGTAVVPPGFTFTYGRVEVRFRVPAGSGLWPAVWLLSPGIDGSYPERPEIDLFEQYGTDPSQWSFHVHLRTAGGAPIDTGQEVVGPDTTAGFHTVALDWRPTGLIWSIDGRRAFTYTGAAIPAVPMYVVLNLAVGGTAGPTRATPSPAAFLVDAVRVSQ